MNGAVTYDGNAHCQITGNVLGLAGEMWFEDGSFKGNRYLADGTKFACIDNDDYGTGLLYRGSMVYRSDWDEDEDAATERNEFYAYGERVEDPSFPRNPNNRYRFNGKEEVEETSVPYIDYGARVCIPSRKCRPFQ